MAEQITTKPDKFFTALEQAATDGQRGLNKVEGWNIAKSDLDVAKQSDNSEATLNTREKVMAELLKFIFGGVAKPGEAWEAVQKILPEKMTGQANYMFADGVKKELENYRDGRKNVAELIKK